MFGSVPLARRNLLSEPRRLLAAAGGVGMALMLILLLDGLWAGIQANVTTYEDNVGADLYVAQPGTRNFFGAVSVIPEDTVDAVRADPDVEWAAAVRGFFSITQLHDRKRSEEHTSELQSLMRISYAVFCLKKKQLYQS